MKSVFPLFTVASWLLLSSLAYAHPAAVGGPYIAGTTTELFMGIGHGCAGLDTYSIKIKLPAGLTSVRPVQNDAFKTITLEKDAADAVTAVTYTKADGAQFATDSLYYKLAIRAKLPATPFTTLYFPVIQTCKSADGAKTVVTNWVKIGASHNPAEAGESEDQPAASLYVYPARQQGWNKYTTPAGVTLSDLAVVFKDALIVWAGDAAYSPNASTAALIAAEDGVEVLEKIEPGTEIWVKY